MKKFALAALAAALLTGGSVAALAVERGGDMSFGRRADSLFLDPVLNDANVDIWIMTNLYDTLIRSTPDGKGLEPGLATEWGVSDDGLEVTLKLREGVKFADGSAMTAEDVKWSLDRARNPDNGIWNGLIGSIGSVEVADANTIVLKLSNPDPTIIPALAVFNTSILPQALFEAEAGATDEEKAQAFAEHPVGTGPFVFESWDRGSKMRIVRNPHHWELGEDGEPLPYLDAVTFEIIPDDATRILKLEAGELGGSEFIPFARVAELEANPNITMELFPSTRVAYLTMNVRPELSDGTPNPLSNQKVRQALNHAIDKDAIVQVVTYGVGVPSQSYMSSTTPMSRQEGQPYPVDLAKAKALLGETEYADGFEVSILALAGNADEIAIDSAVQQMWSQLGVKLNIEQVDNPTRTARYRAGDFQMRNAAWTNDINDPSQITSYMAYYPLIESLHSGWNVDEVNQLFEQSQKETDAAARAAQYARIQEIHVTEGPLVYLYETPYPVAMQANVKGFYQIPLGNNIFAKTHIEK
jgi:peptide/nickel transport system substrate-binding protein